MATKLDTLEQYKALIDKYDTWLFDCDGVLWEGMRLIPNIKEVLQYLRSQSACAIVHRVSLHSLSPMREQTRPCCS